jgi:hypothetical protein
VNLSTEFLLPLPVVTIGGYAAVQAVFDARRKSYFMLAWGLVIVGFVAFTIFGALGFLIYGPW